MGSVRIGCGRCERRIECESLTIEGDIAESLHWQLSTTPAPFSMQYLKDENMRSTVSRPVTACGQGDCPLTDTVFADVARVILTSVTN